MREWLTPTGITHHLRQQLIPRLSPSVFPRVPLSFYFVVNLFFKLSVLADSLSCAMSDFRRALLRHSQRYRVAPISKIRCIFSWRFRPRYARITSRRACCSLWCRRISGNTSMYILRSMTLSWKVEHKRREVPYLEMQLPRCRRRQPKMHITANGANDLPAIPNFSQTVACFVVIVSADL